jgi:DNA-binding SARP family transcriptional activator
MSMSIRRRASPPPGLAGEALLATVDLHLLGTPAVLGPAGRTLLERKAAALLGYLALEGPTPRALLAELLWPGADAARGRNSLRQLLFRLRTAAGRELVEGTERLALPATLGHDVQRLERALAGGGVAAAERVRGALLEGLVFDDCPEFDGWLLVARERVAGLRRRAARAEAEACERQGDLAGALAAAQGLADLDPTDEEACCRLMRLHYRLGHRAAALEAFARCTAALSAQLDARPQEATVAVARAVERDLPLPGAASRPAPARPAVPLTVLRPPVLVGREAAWAVLAEARERGVPACVLGGPGLGKTRLAVDFAAAQGRHLHLWARRSDVGVPYATLVRWLRGAAEAHALSPLAPWVRQEVGHLVPELAPRGTPAGGTPAAHTALDAPGQLRRVDALARAWLASLQGVETLVLDDVHHLDAHTVTVVQYALDSPPVSGRLPHIVACARGEELPEAYAGLLRGLVEAGLAAAVELGPLSREEVAAVVEAVGVPGAEALTGPLLQLSGGNPLLLCEALRRLAEAGALAGGGAALPDTASGAGRALLLQRVARLAPLPQQLVQLAALACEHFDLALAGEVLDAPRDALEAAVRTLRLQQLWPQAGEGSGEGTEQRALLDAVRATTPPAVASLLHRRLAARLAARGAPAADVARHRCAGGLADCCGEVASA